MRIVTEIGIFDGHDFIIGVDTERMLKFIATYGIHYEEKHDYGVIIRLEDFLHVMTSEQWRIYFSYKPPLVRCNKDMTVYKPLMPILSIDGKNIDFIHMVMECCSNNLDFDRWRSRFIEIMILGYGETKFQEILDKVLLTFDNYDKKTQSFFGLMRDRSINQINNNNFNKK